MVDICERLQAVCDKVTGNAPSDVNFGMCIPSRPHQDLDLIATTAKTEIERLRTIEASAIDLFNWLQHEVKPLNKTDMRYMDGTLSKVRYRALVDLRALLPKDDGA